MNEDAVAHGRSKVRKVALNAVWLAMGGLVAQACFVAIEAFIARDLGASSYGVFGTVFSLSLGLIFLVDAGMNWYLIEVASKRPVELPRLVGTGLVLRLALFVVWYPLILVFLRPIGYSADVVAFFSLFFFYALVLTFHDTLASAYSAQQKMHVSALFQASSPVLILLLVHLLPIEEWQLKGVGAAYIIGISVVTAAWFAFACREYIPRVRLRSAPEMLKGSVLYGLSGLLDQLTQRIDLLILSALRPMGEVGLFVAAHRIFDVCMKVGIVASRAVLPMLFKLNAENAELYAQMCRGALRFFAAGGAGLGLFIALAASELMTRIFGAEYAAAAAALEILGFSLALRFVGMGLEAVLMASSHQLRRTNSLAASVIVSGATALALVPQIGIAGAAVARLAGSAVQLVFSLGGANVPIPVVAVIGLIGWPMLVATGCFFVAPLIPLPSIAGSIVAFLLLPCILIASGYLKVSQILELLPSGRRRSAES